VKNLFAGRQEDIRRRMEIVQRAKTIGRCAVSVAYPTESGQRLRQVCSQAADELLGVEGVDAAFILFAEEGHIHISARSLGARNVQVIMEKLGGGGHQTMAAAQLPASQYTMEDAVNALMEAVGE